MRLNLIQWFCIQYQRIDVFDRLLKEVQYAGVTLILRDNDLIYPRQMQPRLWARFFVH